MSLIHKLSKIVDFTKTLFVYAGDNTAAKTDGYVDLREIIIRRPETEPVISTGVIDLDCLGSRQMLFEPRNSSGTRTISSNFEIQISDDSNVIEITSTFSFTGTIVVTLPSDVSVSNPSSIGTWDEVLDTLTIDAGTDDIIEFSFLYDESSSVYDLKVGEVRV